MCVNCFKGLLHMFLIFVFLHRGFKLTKMTLKRIVSRDCFSSVVNCIEKKIIDIKIGNSNLYGIYNQRKSLV